MAMSHCGPDGSDSESAKAFWNGLGDDQGTEVPVGSKLALGEDGLADMVDDGRADVDPKVELEEDTCDGEAEDNFELECELGMLMDGPHDEAGTGGSQQGAHGVIDAKGLPGNAGALAEVAAGAKPGGHEQPIGSAALGSSTNSNHQLKQESGEGATYPESTVGPCAGSSPTAATTATAATVAAKGATATEVRNPLGVASQEDHDDGDDDLPLSGLSMDEDMPSGLSSVARIRGTINKYVLKLCDLGWFKTFKPGAVKALERRLLSHSHEIKGQYHAEVVIAYDQLRERIHALLDFHKSMQAWNDCGVPSKVVECLPPCQILQKFLSLAGATLAPDLAIIMSQAELHSRLGVGSSVADAFKDFDVETFKKNCQELASSEQGVAVEPSATPFSNVKVGVEAEDEGGDICEEKLKPKKKRRLANSDLTYDFKAAPADQLGRIFCDAWKAMVFKLPGDIAEDHDQLNSVINDLVASVEWWSASVKSLPGADAYQKLIEAAICIFKCAHKEERLRPTTVDVRAARKTIFSATKVVHPCSDLARCFAKYEGCNTLMEAAKSYATIGLHDEQAVAKYNAVVDRLNDALGGAFDDLDAWLRTGADGGGKFDLTNFVNVMEIVKSAAVDMYECSKLWSSASLQARADGGADLLRVLMDLICAGVHLQLRECDDMFGRHTWPWETSAFATDVPSEQGASAKVKREGDDVHSGASTSGAAAEPTTTPMSHEGQPAGFASLSNGLQPIKLAATAFKKVNSDFGTVLRCALQAVEKCFESFTYRLGDSFKCRLPEGRHPATIIKQENDISGKIDDICSYISEVAYLVSGQCDTISMGCLSNISVGAGYKDSLSSFCARHRRFAEQEEQFVWTSPCELAEFDHAGQTSAAIFARFMAEVGRMCYDAHSAKVVLHAVQSIMAIAASVTEVHTKVMSECALPAMLPLLLARPLASELYPEGRLTINMEQGTDGPFAHEVHTKSLGILREFVEILDLDAITIPGVHRGEAPCTSMPTKEALATLETVCMVRDISTLASALHHDLLESSAKSKTAVSITDLSEYLTDILWYLRSVLGKLDISLRSHEAMSIERGGWRLQMPFGMLRGWVAAMSIFAGRCLTALLEGFAAHLGRQVKEASAAVPAWSAVFQGPEHKFSEQLASKLMGGRLSLVVKHHNGLHGTLTAMNKVGRILDISPKLALHEVTESSIAIATSTMANLVTTSILARGVDLLDKHRDDPHGPNLAKKFIKEWKDKDNNLYESFWHEVEGLMAFSMAPSPAIKKRLPLPPRCPPSEASSTACPTPKVHRSSSSSSLGASSVSKPDGTAAMMASPESEPKAKVSLKRPKLA